MPFGTRSSNDDRPMVVVAEVSFDRDAPGQQLRQLGESLQAFRLAHGWVAAISGLDDLLAGVVPKNFSKAVVVATSVQPVVPLYDPILVWAWAAHPNQKHIDPMKILRAAIPEELGRVTAPDPDAGV